MSSPFQRFSLLFVALVTALLVAVMPPLGAQTEPPEPPPVASSPLDPLVRGEVAIARLGRQLSTVADGYGLSGEALSQLFLADPTVAVDRAGALVVIDPLAPGEEPVVIPFDEAADVPDAADAADEADADDGADAADAADGADDAGEASPSDRAAFELASLPGAENTIYLDFDGHVTRSTRWNAAYGMTSIDSPAYDIDGDPTAWSSDELDAIAGVWASVAEDFEPWNVNVTTVEPPADDLRRTGENDTRWGVRVVFTDDSFAECGCGGQTYIGAFDEAVDEPTFVYNTDIGVLSESATHQVGHLLGRLNDGTSIGSTTHRDLGARPGGSDDQAVPDPVTDEPDDVDENADVQAPAAPSGAIGLEIEGSVFLGWMPNAEDDLSGYVIRWSASQTRPGSTVATPPVNGYFDVAPNVGDNYYQIFARDESGNLSAPTEIMVSVTSRPSAPPTAQAN